MFPEKFFQKYHQRILFVRPELSPVINRQLNKPLNQINNSSANEKVVQSLFIHQVFNTRVPIFKWDPDQD